jgi:hypothetical protein
MDEKDVKEILEDVPPEERAEAWEGYVRGEVNALLDTFLPEAISGNVGVKYDHPVLRVDPKTGNRELDESKATGVFISVMFDFPTPIEFYAEKPSEEVE